MTANRARDTMRNWQQVRRGLAACYYRRPEWELYNVSKDKWEQTNVVNHPEQAERVAELKSRLAAWMERQRDQQLVHSEPRRLSDRKRWHPGSFQPSRSR